MIAAPVLRWPGSKWRIAEWVVNHLPPHRVYVEPFFGSGGVFYNKPPASVEIINDLDDNVVNLLRVIRDDPDRLSDLLALTPWSFTEYATALTQLQSGQVEDPVERARLFITVTWQQFGKRNMSYRSGWRFRGVDQQTPMTAWRSLPERIEFVADRSMNAQISHMPALKLIQRVNNADVLLYVDPPYLAETRRAGNLYDCEMKSAAEHLELLVALKAHVGPVVLSGYPSDLYTSELSLWHQVSTTARAQSNGHREECLWLNQIAWRRLQGRQYQLIGDDL